MSFRIDITCTDCGKSASLTLDDNAAKVPQSVDFDAISVDELDLGGREYNVLAKANIRTVGELWRYDRRLLLQYQNFGRSSLDRLERTLKEFIWRATAFPANSGSATG